MSTSEFEPATPLSVTLNITHHSHRYKKNVIFITVVVVVIRYLIHLVPVRSDAYLADGIKNPHIISCLLMSLPIMPGKASKSANIKIRRASALHWLLTVMAC